MPDPTIRRRPTPLLDALLMRLAAARPLVRQERVFARVMLLSLGSLITLGRHTTSQTVTALGAADADWSAWHRLFNCGRIALEAGQRLVLRDLVALLAPGAPLPVVLDATQVPRTSRRFPGVGLARAPRSPAWRPGLHLAQRLEVLSGLLPRSPAGDSRAVPIRATWLRSPRTQPIGAVPEQSEGAAAIALLTWLRQALAAAGRPTPPVLALADGAYSTAPVLANLPAQTWLLARCAKNRALFALPSHDPHRPGRPRRPGAHGPTPQQTLHQRAGWRPTRILVRGRTIALTTMVTGPWLVHGAPAHPVLLIVVKGLDAGSPQHRRRRDPQYFLVSARAAADGTWALPAPVAELLAWAWQRWEVEVMHRELKSGFGLGNQQAWSARGAQDTIAWALWTYAQLILTGAHVWGLGAPPGPDRGRWWRPRRWSIGRLLQEVRADLWQTTAFSPRWTRSPDAWAEMTAWLATQTSAALGVRPV
jgi:hypothetical protein